MSTNYWMPRPLRFAPAEIPVLITHRAAIPPPLFSNEFDFAGFLDLLGRYSSDAGTQVAGYCLMPDHYHLVLIPSHDEGVSSVIQALNSMFARLRNQRLAREGPLWRGRFGSALLDQQHYRDALAYVDLNPVRSGLSFGAVGYPWSSAAAHAGLVAYPPFLQRAPFASHFSGPEWRQRLKAGLDPAIAADLRRATRLGLVAGDATFLKELEGKYGRSLARRPRGRPPKSMAAEGGR